MLPVPAFEVGHPLALVVLMKADDAARRHGLWACALVSL
jgi:hypothetical protein